MCKKDISKSDYHYLVWKFKQENKRKPNKKELNSIVKMIVERDVTKNRFEKLLGEII